MWHERLCTTIPTYNKYSEFREELLKSKGKVAIRSLEVGIWKEEGKGKYEWNGENAWNEWNDWARNEGKIMHPWIREYAMKRQEGRGIIALMTGIMK